MCRKSNIINSMIEQHQQVIDAAQLAIDGELTYTMATEQITMIFKDQNGMPIPIPITSHTGHYLRLDLLRAEITNRSVKIAALQVELEQLQKS